MMSAVTIKSRILSALGMFWDKLKTTYVTSTASNAGNNLALAASAGYNLQQQINANEIKKATVYNNEVSLSAGSNTINFSLPADFNESYGVSISWGWPLSTWTNANVSICKDGTIIDGTGYCNIYSGSPQSFHITLTLVYK